MNVSVLMASRSRPNECFQNVRSLQRAGTEGQIEVIIRLDVDDPLRHEYMRIAPDSMLDASITNAIKFIVGPHYGGYRDIDLMIEECARCSTGDVLLLGADDITTQTQNWDLEYVRCALELPLRPINCAMDGDPYPWALPAIPRALYEACGRRFCLHPQMDRAWNAFANYAGHTTAAVTFSHPPHEPNPDAKAADERGNYGGFLHNNWGKLGQEWDAVGKMYAELVGMDWQVAIRKNL